MNIIIPDNMQAMVITGDKHNASLTLASRATPKPAADEVLIKVSHAALNRADLFQLQGSYPAPHDAPADIPGLEVSGIVVMTGAEVTNWQVGEEVCALLSGGGYAEYALAPAAQCLPIPNNVSLAEAASLPEAYATNWMALTQEADLQEGDTLLVHGGSSGIGTAAIQLATSWGCNVYVTTGSAEKCVLCEQLGAHAINYKEQSFVEAIKRSTNGRGVDVVVDIIGGEYIQQNLTLLAPGGHMVSLAFLQSAQAELRMGAILLKGLRWSGCTLRSRTSEEKAAYIAALKQHIWPLFTQKRLKPVIDSTFALKDAKKALDHMQNYLHSGKILLQVAT